MAATKESVKSSLPRVPVSLVRATAPWKRSAGATTEVPDVGIRVNGWHLDPGKLAAYRKLMGSTAEMPLVFPQIALTALHLDLISSFSFPMRAMGLVHPGFVVEAVGELPLGQGWDLHGWVEGARHVRAGLEFDLCGEVRIDGEVVWKSRAVTLSRSKSAAGADESSTPQLDPEGVWTEEHVLDAPEGTGRAFARVSGDVNPIHMHSTSARLFGFSRPIAHGWWIAGRSIAALGIDEAIPGRRLDIAFRRPISLPSQPMLRSRVDGSGMEFGLFPHSPTDKDGNPSRPLVLGQVDPA